MKLFYIAAALAAIAASVIAAPIKPTRRFNPYDPSKRPLRSLGQGSPQEDHVHPLPDQHAGHAPPDQGSPQHPQVQHPPQYGQALGQGASHAPGQGPPQHPQAQHPQWTGFQSSWNPLGHPLLAQHTGHASWPGPQRADYFSQVFAAPNDPSGQGLTGHPQRSRSPSAPGSPDSQQHSRSPSASGSLDSQQHSRSHSAPGSPDSQQHSRSHSAPGSPDSQQQDHGVAPPSQDGRPPSPWHGAKAAKTKRHKEKHLQAVEAWKHTEEVEKGAIEQLEAAAKEKHQPKKFWNKKLKSRRKSLQEVQEKIAKHQEAAEETEPSWRSSAIDASLSSAFAFRIAANRAVSQISLWNTDDKPAKDVVL